ncbi:MAG: type II toxin-antitoxin system HipA family toxin YjjJ [Burkholderiales bacterium]|nr:type II toxin-antitoxin system HipA family toxin YjjJ [Burkholderiales bacterium]
MPTPQDLLMVLRTWHRLPAKQLVDRMKISRATLMRAVQALGPEVISRGKARRTAYAARRPLRGSMTPLSLYKIDREGRGHEVGLLHLTYPAGCALDFLQPFDWPLEEAMQDGWFEGLPYPLEDMRPQGFLGRHFARHHANLLQVSEDPRLWSEDDVLHALSLLGHDQPGNYILGEPAYRQWLEQSQQALAFLHDEQVQSAYLACADNAMAQGVAGSSAGGEFPKFLARRLVNGAPVHVLVKFSGSDGSPGTRRWADLLICEHLALQTVGQLLQIEASRSRVYQMGGRTLLEVERFDRHGLQGRSAVCSWASLNSAFFGLAGKPWPVGAAALLKKGLIDEVSQTAIQRLWHFGQLIANSDMHDGNLSFVPGLQLAPVYDMLPMAYAPLRGVELPPRTFAPSLPLPSEQAAWQFAAEAAVHFWDLASKDGRISESFRQTCAQNAAVVREQLSQPKAGSPS